VAQNNVEQFMDMKELEDEISFSLSRMPVKCKEVYVLHHQNKVTLKNISALLSRPVDTIEKQFRKATSILRNHLTDNIITI
jgi:DNA-directed RNA polymerase specialized sigma24 family protein